MADEFFGSPTGRSMGLGLRVPGSPVAGDPSTRMGLGGLQSTQADPLVAGTEYVPGQYALQSAQRLKAPDAQARMPAAYFNQATNEMYAGDRAFAATDVRSALETAQAPVTVAPQGAGWVPLPAASYSSYLKSLSERRSPGELLGRGAKNVAYGLGTLPGTVASLAGFEETGAALRAPVESFLGDSENEQLRSSLIAENSTLWEKIKDASVESIPFLLTSFAGGLGGAALAGRGVGLTAEAALAAKATGAIRGATYVNLPTHLASMYDAAVQNGQDLSSLDTKAFILGGALANTAIERFGIEGRLFSPAVKDAVTKSAMRTVRDRLVTGGLVGLQEAGTEVFQTATETLLFDPEVRSKFTPQDWKTILPYALETYGESYLVAAGAGALLGGGIGTVLPQGAEAPRTKTQVDTSTPLDLNTTATGQVAEKEAPSDLYGQQSFQPLGLPYIPGAETIGARPVAPIGGEQVIDPNRPLTLQQVGLMRGATQGLRPEDRMAGNITVPGGERAAVLEGEVLPPAPPAARLRRGLPPPSPVAGALPAPDMAAADFTAGAEGVTPTGATPAAAPTAQAAPAQRLRVGAPPATPLVTGQTTDTAMGNQLAAQLAARRAATQQAEAQAAAEAETARQAQQAAGARGAEIETAYAQRAAQAATMRTAEEQAAYDQLSAEQRAYVDADATWETFRPQDGKKQSGVTLRDLAPKAQREWVAAVQQGEADQTLYEKFRTRRPVGRAAPLVDVPTVLQPKKVAPAPRPKAPPKPAVLTKKQRAVAERFLALAPEQQAAVVRALGSTEAETMALLRSDPDAVNAAIDSVVTPPDTTPPDTTPTGTKAAALRAGAAPRPAAGGLKRGATAPKPRAEAAPEVAPTPVAPEPTPEPEAAPEPTPMAEVQATAVEAAQAPTSGRKPRTRQPVEAVKAVDELDADINDFITVLGASEDRANRNAAISGLQLALVDTAMTPKLRVKVRNYLASLGTEAGAAGLSDMTGVNTAVADLSEMIEAFNLAPGPITGTWQNKFRDLIVEVKKEDPDARLGDEGPLLRSFAKSDTDTSPNIQKGRLVPRSGFSAPAAPAAADPTGRPFLANWNTIDGAVDLDGKSVTPMATGRVQLLVRNFVTKLARPPKVTVARNQADLKTKNPGLYARAVAARTQGDFDTAQAMGYSFGDGEVIVFSDRIATEQQLSFVLAHETLGHYGLRAIMPAGKFDALMELIYKGDSRTQRAVDAAMSTNPSISRAEAVEEYLSDYAAVLDTSIVARVWNGIKGFLNKLGIRTGDEMTRYLLDQARRYARTKTGAAFDAQAVGSRLHAVESFGGTGRFSTAPALRDVNISAGLLRDEIGGLPMSIEEGWAYIKGQGVNSVTTWDEFKAKFLSLTNFRARQNPGLARLEELIDETRNISMSLKVSYNERLRDVLNRAIAGEVGGISDKQTGTVNQMLYAGQRAAVAKTRQVDDLGNVPLFTMVDGKLTKNTGEIERLRAIGHRSLAEMRDGFEYDVTFDEAGQTITKKERFAGVSGLTADSIEWKGYTKVREAMDDIELELLKARYDGSLQERDLAFRQIAATVPEGELSAAEREVMTTLSQTYGNLYTSNITQDAAGRAMMDVDFQTYANDILRTANSALIGKDSDRFDTLRQLLVEDRVFLDKDGTERRTLSAVMQPQMADDLIVKLQAFKARAKLGENRYVVQDKIKQIIMSDIASKDADKSTKTTIVTGYTPILRDGRFQMRVEAYVGGKTVRLQDSYREQLVYSQFDSASESMEAVQKTNTLFGATEFEVMAYDQDAGQYTLQKVKLRAVSERALDAIAAPPELNLNEFVRGLRQFDITLTPEKMEDVIVALTRQNSNARNRLERSFTPGAKMDGVMATMRHIESRASTIAKVMMRPRLAELMDRSMESTNRLWNGDAKALQDLKDRAASLAANPTARKEEIADAQRAYEQYAYMYNETNPGGGKPRRTNQFYNEAANTVSFLDGNKNVDESDFGSGPMVSRIRAATSMMQLGGSVATGALNVLSLVTNGVPYLSSYNPKTGFGGGFAVGNVVSAMSMAGKQVGAPGVTSREVNTAEFYDKVSTDTSLQKKYGINAREAAFIAQEIRDGAMIPAQSNALVGTARGRTSSGFAQKFLDGWMWTFNVTEQASRRTLGLASYRLEFARKLAAGNNEADADAAARAFAVKALQYTMGEYSVLNRPPAWRSGIQSFMYMYKVFPTTSVQMFMNLSRNGKLGMVAGIVLLSGIAGLPFAEDLEDLADTLAQRLKITGWQGARFETAKFIDSILPGMSPALLKGFVNEYVPADIAGRTSLGNLLPGTDILLAGSDPARGLGEIFGPAPSMLIGTAGFAADLLALPFSSTVSVEDVVREAPITMLRALGDTSAYLQTGAIVDRRGYVVSNEMTAGTVLARALGFYPAAAAKQYEMIRAAKRMTDYQREVATGFRSAWIRATMRSDRARAREIEAAVADWNAASKGTAMEIRNFVQNSRRALKEARRPAMERTLRSAPDAAERDLRSLVDLWTSN